MWSPSKPAPLPQLPTPYPKAAWEQHKAKSLQLFGSSALIGICPLAQETTKPLTMRCAQLLKDATFAGSHCTEQMLLVNPVCCFLRNWRQQENMAKG